MKKSNYLLIISFIVILFMIPLMGMIESDSAFSTIENRKLQKFPALNEGGIEGFTDNIENYVVDQFPKRDHLLDLYTKLQLFLNKTKIRNTIVHEDWLFVRDYNVNKNNLNDLVCQVKETVNKNKDIGFYYVIFPSKTAMLADSFPKYIDGSISKNNNALIKEKLGDIQGLNIVDIFDMVIAKSSPKERVNHYYQTDFHWNEKGAFNAFELMATHIWNYDIFKVAESKLGRVEYENKYFKGDLERRFSGNIKNRDMPAAYETINSKDFTYYTSIDGKEPVEREAIIAINIDKEEIGYNDIFTYNVSCLRVINENPIIEKSVLVLKDSYFNAMVDPMSTIFRELIIIDPRYYDENHTFTEVVQEKKPDYIFFCYLQSNVDKDLIEF